MNTSEEVAITNMADMLLFSSEPRGEFRKIKIQFNGIIEQLALPEYIFDNEERSARILLSYMTSYSALKGAERIFIDTDKHLLDAIKKMKDKSFSSMNVMANFGNPVTIEALDEIPEISNQIMVQRKKEEITPGIALGIDIGGTNTKLALVSGRDVLAFHEFETVPGDVSSGRELCDNIIDNIKSWLPESPSTVGICVPGPVKDGEIIALHNLLGKLESSQYENNMKVMNFLGQNIKEALEIDGSISIMNDGAAHGYMEAVNRNLSKGIRAMISLGTGFGYVTLVNGVPVIEQPQEGGHIIIDLSDDAGTVCSCGSPGCLEGLTSSSAVVRLALEHGFDFQGGKSGAGFVGLAAVDEKHPSHQTAQDIWKIIGQRIAQAAIAFHFLENIDELIIGGGVARGHTGPIIVKNALEHLRINYPGVKVTVSGSILDGEHVVYGAALGAAFFALEKA